MPILFVHLHCLQYWSLLLFYCSSFKPSDASCRMEKLCAVIAAINIFPTGFSIAFHFPFFVLVFRYVYCFVAMIVVLVADVTISEMFGHGVFFFSNKCHICC